MTTQPNSGNPNWKAILDVIPQEFHNLVTPKLQEWDQAVNSKFQEIHQQYEPLKAYKPLADHGIEGKYAEAAVKLADEMQRNPQVIADQMIKQFNLDYLSAEEAAQRFQSQPGNNSGDQENLFGDNDDLFKDPRIQKLMQGFEAVQNKLTEREQMELQQQQADEWEDYLDTLEEKAKEDNLPFNRTIVTALAAQTGMSGEDAVKEYHLMLAREGVTVGSNEDPQQQAQQPPAPPVMGTGGSVGSGSPDGSVDFGNLSKNDMNAAVEQILRQAAESEGN